MSPSWAHHSEGVHIAANMSAGIWSTALFMSCALAVVNSGVGVVWQCCICSSVIQASHSSIVKGVSVSLFMTSDSCVTWRVLIRYCLVFLGMEMVNLGDSHSGSPPVGVCVVSNL